MKLKEYMYMIGLKPRPRRYGYALRRFDLPGFGPVEYAQWLHPSETEKIIDPAAVDQLKTFLEPGDVCIDIGAHSGDTALPMALAVGPRGLVFALEPNPYVFHVLNKNAALNRDKTCIFPLMAAAAAADEDMVFEYSDAGFCNGGFHEGISRWKHGHAFTQTVTGICLSSYLRSRFMDRLDRLKFIKVDAEGYDLTILTTIEDIIKKYRPYIKTEVYVKTDRNYREKMLGFLEQNGYAVYMGDDDSHLKGDPVTLDTLLQTRHCDLFCVPE